MREFLIEIFGNFSRVIIFLHIASAVLLVGGMFVFRLVVDPAMRIIEDEKARYESYIKMIGRFFIFLVPVMFILVSASVFMNVGLGFRYGDPTTFVMIHTKEAIWSFIAFNFIYMYIKYVKAKNALAKNDYLVVDENIILMTHYLIPLNTVLGFIAIYLGIVVRGY
ncbi:MAG: hypothetical protein PHN38_08080 [Sulfurospirillaceae bacterium]|nr:hypothetical protein [Sulfurospirillaceae bacterium]MDD3462892.1 hypothetical protein [Sulfurospirillaceae bacterium]